MKVSGDFGCQEDFEPSDFRERDFDMTLFLQVVLAPLENDLK